MVIKGSSTPKTNSNEVHVKPRLYTVRVNLVECVYVTKIIIVLSEGSVKMVECVYVTNIIIFLSEVSRLNGSLSYLTVSLTCFVVNTTCTGFYVIQHA